MHQHMVAVENDNDPRNNMQTLMHTRMPFAIEIQTSLVPWNIFSMDRH